MKLDEILLNEGAHDFGRIFPGNLTLTQVTQQLRAGNHSSDPYSDENQLGRITVIRATDYKQSAKISTDINVAYDQLLDISQKWEPLLASKVTADWKGNSGDFWLVAGWLAE